jgi:uncharacterized protein
MQGGETLRKAAAERREMTADEVRKLLKLEPHATCGYVRETYRSALPIASGGLPEPFADGRPAGSALFFMVTPSAPVHLHRIRNDQLYHYYLGDTLEVLMLPDGGTVQRALVGPDIGAGQHVQLFIPGNTFHTARLAPKGSWFLGGSTEWPGVLPADVETGDVEELAELFPGAAADLRAIAKVARAG